MAYFFGKGTNANFDLDNLSGLSESQLFDTFGLTGGQTFNPAARTPIPFGATRVQPRGPIEGGQVAATPATTGGYDALIDALFGTGFETIRGIGGRSRESVYDMLAREGLLGTGAAKGVAQDIAWQTERGITDLITNLAQMRSQEEQDAMNLMLTYLSMMSQGWRG